MKRPVSENFHRARVRENPLLAIVGNPPAKRRGGSEEFTFLAKEGQHFAVARVLLNIGLQPCVLSQREGYMVRAALPAGVTKESVGLALSRTGADRPLRRNPSRRGREVHPLAYEARDRYREDMGAGHSSAAEYWRGQAGAFFTGNPSDSAAVEKAKTELAESIRERKEHNKLKTPGRLKGDKRHGEWLKKARSIQSKESRREKVLNKLIGEGAGEEFFASIQWEDNPSHPYGPYWRSCACGRDYELGVSGVEEGCNDCMHYRGESPVAGLAGKKKIKGREGASKKDANTAASTRPLRVTSGSTAGSRRKSSSTTFLTGTRRSASRTSTSRCTARSRLLTLCPGTRTRTATSGCTSTRKGKTLRSRSLTRGQGRRARSVASTLSTTGGTLD